ncbi:MAG: hypothetical protein Q9166_006898 [cf. Caloplaca sp. 2 TL-2023]
MRMQRYLSIEYQTPWLLIALLVILSFLTIAFLPRIRRVKCDEGKPDCQKCKSTGRKCDGYVSKKDNSAPAPEKEAYAIAKMDQPLKQVSHVVVSPLPIAIGGWEGTLDELRGFDYFRVRTSKDLAYSLNASLQELVLQKSHRHQAIKHGAIALGSLGETIRINSSSISLNTSVSPAFVRHEFARSQYYKAIRILQKDIKRGEKEMVEIALISCFLFIVFEFLQGNDQSTVTHLRSGLAIIRKQYFPHADSGPDTKEHLKLTPMQSEISRIFHILDTQATMWLGLRAFQAEPYVPVKSVDKRFPPPITPTSFDSLDDACADLINLISSVYNFRRESSKHDYAASREHVPASVYAQRDALLDELDVHRRQLGKFLARQIDAQNLEDPHRITILRINRKVTTMMLATYLEPHEDRFYASCMSHFWQIISLATFILRQTPEMPRRVVRVVHKNHKAEDTMYGRQIFSFFAGLIQPLYFTAIKCREKVTAQKAIYLLEMEPWREGAWDSAAMARIARRKMEELEKKGWYEVKYDDMSVESTGKVGGELSNEWPLATDPFITYPV